MIKSASSVCSLEFVEHPVDSIIVVEVVTEVLPDKLACVVRGIFVVISNKSGLDVDVNSVFGITIGEVAVVVDLDVDDNVANSCVVSGVAEVGFLGSDETLSELDTASVDSVVTGNSLLNSIVDTTVLGSTVEVLKAISEIVGTKSNVIDTGTAVDSTDVAGRAVVDTTVSGIVSNGASKIQMNSTILWVPIVSYKIVLRFYYLRVVGYLWLFGIGIGDSIFPCW